MKKRNPFAVVVLSIITLGIYGIVWDVKTKNEMKSLGAEIPTAWLIIVPFANIWWLWKYSQGVEKVTNNNISGILAFVLLWLLGFIGAAIIQSEFNKIAPGDVLATPAAPQVPTPEDAPSLPTSTPPIAETPPAPEAPAPPAPPTSPKPNTETPSGPPPPATPVV